MNDHSGCEIEYELLPGFMGQGIMSEAVQAVIGYVAQTLQLHQIVATCHKDNMGSIALLRKLDFIQSAELDQENPDLITFKLEKHRIKS